MKYLTQNGKIKDSSKGPYYVVNWGIPAFRSASGEVTCPAAGQCAKGCYATQGSYNWTPVKAAYERRLSLSQSADFQSALQADLDAASKRAAKQRKQLVIRIHDSGDFYSLKYIKDWFEIMRANKRVLFYAYTKQVRLFKALEANDELPTNLVLIYSEGGIFDNEINIETDRHSRVFSSLEDLRAAGYADVTSDDTGAFLNRKVGLVFHGYKSTAWRTDVKLKA